MSNKDRALHEFLPETAILSSDFSVSVIQELRAQTEDLPLLSTSIPWALPGREVSLMRGRTGPTSISHPPPLMIYKPTVLSLVQNKIGNFLTCWSISQGNTHPLHFLLDLCFKKIYSYKKCIIEILFEIA